MALLIKLSPYIGAQNLLLEAHDLSPGLECFYKGQAFIFGITRKPPADLGIGPERN